MKLKDLVPSTELSNKIKKLGITTPSLFFREWTGAKDDEIEMWPNHKSYYGVDNVNCHTVAELGEMLPAFIKPKYILECYKHKTGWHVGYKNAETNKYSVFIGAKSEANARAKMVIYLKEKGLK